MLTMLVMSTTITVLVAAGVFPIGMMATDVIETTPKSIEGMMNKPCA
jgi:hypothetical protein